MTNDPRQPGLYLSTGPPIKLDLVHELIRVRYELTPEQAADFGRALLEQAAAGAEALEADTEFLRKVGVSL